MTYKPGKYLFIADTLSRAYLISPEFDDLEMLIAIHSFVNYLRISEEREHKLRLAQKMILLWIVQYLKVGWLDKNRISSNRLPFLKLKYNFSICNGLLFLGNKLVVPENIQIYTFDTPTILILFCFLFDMKPPTWWRSRMSSVPVFEYAGLWDTLFNSILDVTYPHLEI